MRWAFRLGCLAFATAIVMLCVTDIPPAVLALWFVISMFLVFAMENL